VAKVRLDTLLTSRGLAETRQKAQAMILAGQVLVNDQAMDKPGKRVQDNVDLTVRGGPRYVSRGGLKLEHALDRFGLDVSGKIAVDVGASTGGFTDCLLQRGALRVYAIDVGYGQLAWQLRQDPRVVVLERTNIRYLEGLAEPVELATIDVSFISLELVWPAVLRLLEPRGKVLALIKPQFEAGREQVQRGGVVRDPGVHRQVLEEAVQGAVRAGLRMRGLTASPLRGPAGNVEFFAYLTNDVRLDNICLPDAMEVALAEARSIQGKAAEMAQE
jgi:23S rRNA (cytidine1920-2'-O)/16S rRNA (cytidine1409-2'-O)-methyltransferase